MRYRLYLDNCIKGKNQVVIPYEIGECLRDSATVYIDGNPVYTEIVIPDFVVGSDWDETSNPAMDRVGTGVDYLLTFEAPYACQYVDLGTGNGVGELLIETIGSIWDESQSPTMERTTTTTNTDCNVIDWWTVDELGWLRTEDASGNTVYVKVAGVYKEGQLFIKVDGSWKQAEPNVKVSGTWK